jgi:hypothetical protein
MGISPAGLISTATPGLADRSDGWHTRQTPKDFGVGPASQRPRENEEARQKFRWAAWDMQNMFTAAPTFPWNPPPAWRQRSGNGRLPRTSLDAGRLAAYAVGQPPTTHLASNSASGPGATTVERQPQLHVVRLSEGEGGSGRKLGRRFCGSAGCARHGTSGQGGGKLPRLLGS